MKFNHISLLILLLIGLILVSGCIEEKECKKASDCVLRNCSTAECEDNNCTYSPVSDCCGNNECELGETYEDCVEDCPDCDDENECTTDSYDYEGQECTNEPIIPCCGNEICDEDVETHLNCSTDCPDCDDNSELTVDSFDYTAQECENVATHYFIDDFESGTQDWTFTDAEGGTTTPWSTTMENGNTVLEGTGHNWAIVQGREWENYIFKFRFKRVSGQLHANFRFGSQRYFVNLRQDGTGVELRKTPATGDTQTLKTVSFSPGITWHTMEIRGYDNMLNVYMDDVLLIKYKDTEDDAILSGRAAFETTEGKFLIDDVEIKVVASTDVIYP